MTESTVAETPEDPNASADQWKLIRRLAAVMVGVLLVWLGCEAAAALGVYSSPLRHAIYNNHFYAFPLLSLSLLHVASGPTRVQMWTVVGLAAALTFALAALGQRAGAAIAARDVGGDARQVIFVVALCQAVGVACLLELAWRAWRSAGAARRHALLYFLPSSLFIGFTICGPFVMGLSSWVNPTTYDSLAYAADGAFGLQPSAVVARWFEAAPALRAVCLGIYNTNAMTFVFVYLMQLRQPRLPPVDVFSVIVVAGTLAPPLYLLFPVCGPKGLLDEAFRDAPPAAEVLARESRSPIDEASTAMPSLHTAVVLLCCWHSRGLPRWCRAICVVWLAGTLLATIGFGFHYLVDLIVAVPYALLVQALCAPALPLFAVARWVPAVIGTLFMALWFVLIRFGLDVLNGSPLAPLLITLTTVGVSLWQEWVLHKNTSRRDELAAA